MKKEIKKKKSWHLAVQLIVLVLLMVVITSQIRQYYFGFNSVDNNFNYQNTIIEGCNPDAPTVFELQDIGSDGKSRPLFRYYIAGLNQMEYAFMSNMLLTLLLGMMLREILL